MLANFFTLFFLSLLILGGQPFPPENDFCATTHVNEANPSTFSYVFSSNTFRLDVNNGLCSQRYGQLISPVMGETDCSSGFIKTIGVPGETEIGYHITASQNGTFFIGGGNETHSTIMEIDADGTILWEKSFNAIAGSAEMVRYLFVDTEGNLVLTGRDHLIVPDEHYIAKFDPVSQEFVWFRTWQSPYFPRIDGMFENPGNGNYIFYGLVEVIGNDNYIMEVDKDNGNPQWQRHFEFGGTTDHFWGHNIVGNDLYLGGAERYGANDLSKIRAAVWKMDLSGNVDWARTYFHSQNQSARTYTIDLAWENDTIVALGRGSLSGSNLNPAQALLYKLDSSGNLLWGKRYSIAGGTNVNAQTLLPLPDGYVFHGFYYKSGVESLFLIRTDKTGNVIWAKEVDTPSTDWSYSALISDGSIFFTGHTEEFDTGGNSDILFGRMPIDIGLLNEDCPLFKDLTITTAPITQTYDQPFTPVVSNQAFLWPSGNATPQDISSVINDVPGCECLETQDSCLVAPDAYFQLLSGTCNGDSLLVTVEVCNEGEGILYAGTPVNFYEGDPSQGGAPLVGQSILPTDLPKDSCMTWLLSLGAATNTIIYGWVNEEGNIGYDSLECDISDNIGGFFVLYTAPTLDLGPDTAMCALGMMQLEANPGFASYQWQDGSTEAQYTALGAGQLWVTAIDSCGGVQTDTVQITLFSDGESFDTLAFCPGDTVLVFGNPETTAGDYTEFFIGFMGCDSLAHITLVEASDTTFNSTTATICADSSINFFGEILNTTGVYVHIDSSNACIQIDSLDLDVVPSQTISESISTCANEPVDIFGIPTALAGTYSQVFMGQNGCDSVHTIALAVLDTAATTESLTICNGESILIFGNLVSTSGTYSQTFGAFNGCDSTHTVTLTVLSPVNIGVSIEDACADQMNGSATAQVTGGLPPYTYDWGSGPTEVLSISNLAPGSYTLLVTDANGCMESLGFTIDVSPAPNLQLEIQDVSCYGDSDGALNIISADPGLEFGLDGQTFSDQTGWTDLSPGSQSLYVLDGNSCTFEIAFEIGQPDPLSLLLPAELTIQLGEALQLSAVVSPPGGVYLYNWSPPEGLSCLDCPDPLVQTGNSTTYLLVVTDTLGCRAQASVVINVERNQRIYIPNIFSPNADGINDVFMIFGGPELVRISSLKIFDRWGEKVFEGFDLRPNDLGQGWDGTFKGKPMKPAVFGYLAEVEFADGLVLTFNGSITLLR